MKYRQLGKTGPSVSAIGMGRGSQPVRAGEPLEQEFNSAIRRARDLGVTLFDSSDAYWRGRHEALLGAAIRPFRSEVLVTSKFGNIDLPDGKKATNGRPEYVRQSCDASLKRLDLDIIDIYYLHRVDPGVPIEDTVGEMSRLIERGKVRWIGICEAAVANLKRAHATYPLATLQSEYSLWFRDVESEIIPACRELGVAYVAFAPLGRGLLTGRIRTPEDLPENDRRRAHPRFAAENLAHNVRMVERLEAMAKGREISASQLALAWLLAQGDFIVPIPGTNHAANVEQNAAAADIELSKNELDELDEMFPVGAGAGARGPAGLLRGMGI